MEESITKFISFLEEICQIEIRSDTYRAQLSLTSNLKLVFNSLDYEQKGEVTCPDILKHCLQNNLKLQTTDEEIIGKYFRNFEKGLSYDQFCSILKPKIKSNTQSSEKEAMLLFTEMVSELLSSYNLLESSRRQLIQNGNSNQIIAHFKEKYESPEGFSKETLRKFMNDHNPESKEKFTLLESFIYGEIGTFVEWEEFFFLPIQESEEKNQENIHKNEQNLKSSPSEKPRNVSFQAGYQEDFVEQISFKNINMTSKENEEINESFEVEEANKHNKNFEEERKLEIEVKRQSQRQTYNYIKSPLKSPRESFNNFLTKKCYQRTTTRNTTSKYDSKRAPSNIKLRIEEIEMNDFTKLINFQKVPLSPKPHHIAYHPNLRNFENPTNNISNSKMKTPKEALYKPIYSRNRISNILYGIEKENITKGFSPLLRY